MIAARLDDQPREQVDQADPPLDRDARVPRPLGREADRAPAPGRPSSGAAGPRTPTATTTKTGSCVGHLAEEVALAQEQEAGAGSW